MVNVFVNRRPVHGPWGGGNNFITALFDLGKDFDLNITYKTSDRIDAILMIDPRYDEMGVSINEIADFKSRNPSCPVFYRVNECDARKGTNDIDDLIVKMSLIIDEYIFVSNWLKDYFITKGLIAKRSSVIYNGVNKDYFYPNNSLEIGKKLKIITHHWSNNVLKGFDIYEELDQFLVNNDIEFTYVGRDRGTFKNTVVIPPKSGKDLGDAIRNYDVYLSASRFDPGPNHIIEAVASGLPILAHRDGGGAVEFAGKCDTYGNFDELTSLIQNRKFRKSEIIFEDWSKCIEKYAVKIHESQ